MPGWALSGRTPLSRAVGLAYWRATDKHERVNGRLYRHLELALPLALDHGQRLALAREFIEDIFRRIGVRLPYMLTMHAGRPTRRSRRKVKNPHCDVLFSERIADGIDRTPERWFARAAASPKGRKMDPAAGGALKTETLKPAAWLAWARMHWAELSNRHLAAAGHDVRVDHRTLEAQGIACRPGRHLGPKAAGFEERTGQKSRRRAYVERCDQFDQEVEDAETALAAVELAAAGSDSEPSSERVLMLDTDDGWETDLEEAQRRRLQEDLVKRRRDNDERSAERLAAVHLTDQRLLSRWLLEQDRLMSAWSHRAQAAPFAREWRLTPTTGGGAFLFEQYETGAKVLDFGPTISVANGNAAEALLAVKLVEAKVVDGSWYGPVVVTGSAEFKLALIRAALDAGVEIQPKAGEDSELLARVREELQPSAPPIADPLARMREAWVRYTDSASAPRAFPGAAPPTPGARKS